jgi:hypothetical protein
LAVWKYRTQAPILLVVSGDSWWPCGVLAVWKYRTQAPILLVVTVTAGGLVEYWLSGNTEPRRLFYWWCPRQLVALWGIGCLEIQNPGTYFIGGVGRQLVALWSIGRLEIQNPGTHFNGGVGRQLVALWSIGRLEIQNPGTYFIGSVRDSW